MNRCQQECQEISLATDLSRANFLLGKVEELEQKLSSAERVLAEKNEENRRLRTRPQQAKGDNTELMARVRTLMSSVDKLTEKLELSGKKVLELEAEVSSLKDQLEEVKHSDYSENISSLQALRDELEEKGREIEENRKELEEEKAYFEEGKEAFVDAVWRAVRSEFQAEVLSLNLQLKELRKYSSVEFPPEFAKKEEALREAEKTLREDIRKQAKKWQEILAREQEVKEKEKKLEDIIEKRVREEMLQIVKGVDK